MEQSSLKRDVFQKQTSWKFTRMDKRSSCITVYTIFLAKNTKKLRTNISFLQAYASTVQRLSP